MCVCVCVCVCVDVCVRECVRMYIQERERERERERVCVALKGGSRLRGEERGGMAERRHHLRCSLKIWLGTHICKDTCIRSLRTHVYTH